VTSLILSIDYYYSFLKLKNNFFNKTNSNNSGSYIEEKRIKRLVLNIFNFEKILRSHDTKLNAFDGEIIFKD